MVNIIANGLAWLFIFYVVAGMTVYAFQRRIMYAPDRTRVNPETIGVDGLRELTLEAKDGTKLIAWYKRAEPGKPTLLYFHGKKGNLAVRRDRIKQITRSGYGLFMLSYRSYGGSEGRPTEPRNIADAVAAYDYLRMLGLKEYEIVAYGESLGTGVATQLAARRQTAAVVLEAPFTSIVAVGKLMYPLFPVGAFINDKYPSIDYIKQINAPLMIVHGTRDKLIPIELGERLFQAAVTPKEMIRMANVGHTGLFRAGIWPHIDKFIQARVKLPTVANPQAEHIAGRRVHHLPPIPALAAKGANDNAANTAPRRPLAARQQQSQTADPLPMPTSHIGSLA